MLMDARPLAASPAHRSSLSLCEPHPNSRCDSVRGSHIHSQFTEITEFREQREKVQLGKDPKVRIQLGCQVRGQKALVAQVSFISCPTFPDLVEEFRMQYSPSRGSPRGSVALNNLK